MSDPIVAPNIEFNTGDRGGEYLPKLQALAAGFDAVIAAFNTTVDGNDVLSAYLALSVEDYKGSWDDIVTAGGALNQPAVSDYDGVMWRLESDIANVTAAAVPSDGNADWSRESERFATAAQGLLAASSVQPGDGGVLGSADAFASGDNVGDNPLGGYAFYQGTHVQAVADGYPDIGVVDSEQVRWITHTYGTSGASKKVVQRTTQIFSVGGQRGISFLRVNNSNTWYGWTQEGSGSASVSSYVTTNTTYTSANESSDDIVVPINFAEVETAILNFNGSPLPSPSGDFIVNISGLPTDKTDLSFSRQIKIKRGGRKGVTFNAVDHAAVSMTIDWPATPQFGSNSSSWEMIQVYWTPDDPGTLFFSIVDGRP